MVYEDDLVEKKLPETLLKSGDLIHTSNSENNSISKSDSAFMHNYLLETANYSFKSVPLHFYSLSKISTLSINKCTLIITKGEEGNSYSSSRSFMLVSSNDEYIKKASINDLFEMPLFIKSLQSKYTINTEEDARLFQYVLDDLAPINKSDIELKTFYKKENMWIFVKDKQFYDLNDYILLLKSNNRTYLV